MEKIVSLCKRRGFVYPTSQLYGGIGGFYDYGPLGVEMVRNIKRLWWDEIVTQNDNIVGLDSSIILNPKVWEASGHVSSFVDPLTECKVCNKRFRADQEDEISDHEKFHNKKGDKKAQWTEPKQFNLLFKTFVGILENKKSQAYLRGETCQGIFINFQNILSSNRLKIPMGIAQIGKAFRNEVTPGKFLFRVREFEQMELEYFVHPEKIDEAFEFWKKKRMKWVLSLGLLEENVRFRQHNDDERAFYTVDSWDIEYNYPEWGFKELEGIANRTDYDLKTHAKFSGKDFSYKDPVTNKSFYPYVVEPSIGIERLFLALISDAYFEDEKRVILKLNKDIAPYKAAVFPLVSNKEDIVNKARDIYTNLKKIVNVVWDERGNIGKRYLAQDEAGTPACITIDYETLENGSVTLRDRDTTKQERVKADELPKYLI
ncbi:glycine--tRNA ligase [Patescibacteria group bacterium]